MRGPDGTLFPASAPAPTGGGAGGTAARSMPRLLARGAGAAGAADTGAAVAGTVAEVNGSRVGPTSGG